MLRRLSAFGECVVLVVALAGCAPRVAVAPIPLDHLRKIAVVEVPEPAVYEVVNVANEVRFGGGLLNMQHGEEFTNVLRERGFSVSRGFNERLVAALKSAGFDVELIQAVRRNNTLTHGDTNADGVLLVVLGAGYKGSDFTDYLPQIQARVVLLKNEPGKETPHYKNNFWYGSMNPLIGGIQIDADPAYSYGSFGKLMESNAQAGEGLVKGATAISDRLAKEVGALRQ